MHTYIVMAEVWDEDAPDRPKRTIDMMVECESSEMIHDRVGEILAGDTGLDHMSLMAHEIVRLERV